MRTVKLALVAAGCVAQATATPAACVGLAGTADGFAKETAVSRAQRALEDYVNQYRAENNLGGHYPRQVRRASALLASQGRREHEYHPDIVTSNSHTVCWQGVSQRRPCSGRLTPCGAASCRSMASLSGAIKGALKQPYAIATKDGSPFGLAGLWENCKNPNTGEWERTFAVITVPSNKLVGHIHNRLPALLEPGNYERWLGPEPDPDDLLITYASEPMTTWPISTRVEQAGER